LHVFVERRAAAGLCVIVLRVHGFILMKVMANTSRRDDATVSSAASSCCYCRFS
jgi:hypothetical protein